MEDITSYLSYLVWWIFPAFWKGVHVALKLESRRSASMLWLVSRSVHRIALPGPSLATSLQRLSAGDVKDCLEGLLQVASRDMKDARPSRSPTC